eukprot:2508335-Prymnesium_polylepis.1
MAPVRFSDLLVPLSPDLSPEPFAAAMGWGRRGARARGEHAASALTHERARVGRGAAANASVASVPRRVRGEP